MTPEASAFRGWYPPSVVAAVTGYLERIGREYDVPVIDARTFRFMVDEVPHFAMYIMGAMARRIRGMGQAM